jgi:hypothetical protein
MRGTATMIRMLGAIVGAAGKADMLSTGPWQPLGRELFRIAPGHRMGPRTLVDRFCHEPPGKGVELEPRFGDLWTNWVPRLWPSEVLRVTTIR